MSGELRPGMGVGAPKRYPDPAHQPIVPMAGGIPPRCTCGIVGGRGVEIDGTPLLADHLKDTARLFRNAATERLEELRVELREERISYSELAELQSLAEHISPDDVELREAAGIPEHDDTPAASVAGSTLTEGNPTMSYTDTEHAARIAAIREQEAADARADAEWMPTPQLHDARGQRAHDRKGFALDAHVIDTLRSLRVELREGRASLLTVHRRANAGGDRHTLTVHVITEHEDSAPQVQGIGYHLIGLGYMSAGRDGSSGFPVVFGGGGMSPHYGTAAIVARMLDLDVDSFAAVSL